MTTLKVEAAPHAEAFGELPSVFDAAISPDGTEIAIIANSNGEYFASVMSLVDESIEVLLLFGKVKIF